MALEWSKNGVFWVRFGHSVVLLMRGKACAGAGEEQGRNGSFGGRTVGVFVIAMPWLYSAGIDEQNGGFFHVFTVLGWKSRYSSLRSKTSLSKASTKHKKRSNKDTEELKVFLKSGNFPLSGEPTFVPKLPFSTKSTYLHLLGPTVYPPYR